MLKLSLMRESEREVFHPGFSLGKSGVLTLLSGNLFNPLSLKQLTLEKWRRISNTIVMSVLVEESSFYWLWEASEFGRITAWKYSCLLQSYLSMSQAVSRLDEQLPLRLCQYNSRMV